MQRISYNIIITTILALTAAFAHAGAVQIRVSDNIKVSNKVVTISDLAWVNSDDQALVDRLQNMIVAEKDELSNRLTVTSFDISRCLSRGGLNPAAIDIYGSLECRVTFTGPGSRVEQRKHVKPAVEQVAIDNSNSIRSELDRQVANTTGYDLDRLVIEWDCKENGLLERVLDSNRYQIKPQRSVSLGNVRFMVIDNSPALPENVLPQHEKFYNKARTFYVNGKVQYLSEYVVANRDMKAGELIRDNDVKLVPQLVSSISQVGVSSLDAVVGKELTRTIQAEQVIKSNMVKRLMLVDRNSPVYVRYNTSAVSITVKGSALESGGKNDVIAVKVTHKQEGDRRPVSQVLYCKVIATGEVVVVDENELGNSSEEFAAANRREN